MRIGNVALVLVAALWLCAEAGTAQRRKGGARRSTLLDSARRILDMFTVED